MNFILLDEMIYASSFYNDEMLAKGKLAYKLIKNFMKN